MSLKLGTTNIILPFSKAYLGSILKYQKSGGGYIDTEFTACPFPTEWTEVTAALVYTATNNYGLWRIWADNAKGGTYSREVYRAFDNSTNSAYTTEDDFLSSNTACTYIGIDMPCMICPANIYIRGRYVGNTTTLSTVEGLNENGNWETVVEIPRITTSTTNKEITVETEKFYSKFRLKLTRYSSTYPEPLIYEFQITAGTIREGA